MKLTRLSHDRTGFTITELLVSMSVIGIILAITVPAIQQARETARRTDCSIRMRQFGVAMHAFEEANRSYPPNQMRIQPADRGWYSPHVSLLGYLGQSSLLQQIEADRPMQFLSLAAWRNSPVSVKQPFSFLLCPSDTGRWGTNYVYCTGASTSTFGKTQSGAFSQYIGHTSGEFVDGMSTTIAMSEHLISASETSPFDKNVHNWFSNLESLTTFVDIESILPEICQSGGVSPAPFDHTVGWQWYIGSYGRTWYNHKMTPNARSIDCSAQGSIDFGSSTGVHPPRSRHHHGVNTLAMDGAVRYISDSIDKNLWHALATIAGSETAANW